MSDLTALKVAHVIVVSDNRENAKLLAKGGKKCSDMIDSALLTP